MAELPESLKLRIAEVVAPFNPVEVDAQWEYDRKGANAYDPLGSERNASYGSGSDDIVVTVTYRLSRRSMGAAAWKTIAQIHQDLVRADLQQQIEDAAAVAAAANLRAEELSAKLDEMS